MTGTPAEQYDIPETIEGVRCSLEVHRGRGTRGLRVPCPHSGNCKAPLWTAEFVSSAAVCFWLLRHTKWELGRHDVQNCLWDC